ncbi:MAG TPA: hypothetical protein VFA81_01920 [Burkholderiales bacterium]|nr:hypothetical protein [Burkholderiales bacterium]
MTAQGHPRAIFQRAIERGNLTVAEATLRTEIPRPTLIDLLDLTGLIAFKQPERFARVAARWLLRYLEAAEDATIDDAVLITSLLQALGGRHHSHARAALREIAEEANRRGRRSA